MKILISGSNGFIGSELVSYLTEKGHTIFRLVRDTAQEGEIFWNPDLGVLHAHDIENFDVFINLSGENIASSFWTKDKKKKILDSRVQATKLLCNTAAQLQKPPKVIINASAIGFYGNTEDQVVDEKSPFGTGFLAHVCKEWEQAAETAIQAGIRVVFLRFGLVLSGKGGALGNMLFPFKLGLGGVIGSGKQYISWIALDDIDGIVEHVINNETLKGPVNAVTPNPVTNYEFTKALGRMLNRPTFLPFPEFMAKMIFGEMADELFLTSSRVQPTKLQKSGYQFRYPDINKALAKSIGGK